MDEEDFIILKIWKRPMKKFRRTGESQEDIDHFINRQKSANTNKKTATDMKTLLHYMEANGMIELKAYSRRSYGGSPLNASGRKCVLTENKQTWPIAL